MELCIICSTKYNLNICDGCNCSVCSICQHNIQSYIICQMCHYDYEKAILHD